MQTKAIHQNTYFSANYINKGGKWFSSSNGKIYEVQPESVKRAIEKSLSKRVIKLESQGINYPIIFTDRHANEFVTTDKGQLPGFLKATFKKIMNIGDSTQTSAIAKRELYALL